MKYRVYGIAFVPVEVEMQVEADNALSALSIARNNFKKGRSKYVVANSADEGAAFDWEPTAEPINHPPA